MRGILITVLSFLTALILAATMFLPILDSPGNAKANPNCAGNSTNFKQPNGGVRHNFNGC
jgi:hypothetical protein